MRQSLFHRLQYRKGDKTSNRRDQHDKGNSIARSYSRQPLCRTGCSQSPTIRKFDHRPEKNQITDFFGRDSKARRGWNAFDSSPVVVGDFLFWPGENGCLYKFRRAQGKLTLAAALRYTINGSAPGVENSLCVYRNYGFFGDNHGNILAVNLNTMKPVWSYNNHDDIDGSIVCKVEKDTPYIYCGCEVDKQGNEGICHIVKLDGRNGNRIWELQIPCKRFTLGEKALDGGMYCTPLLGMGDCSHLLFANICRNGADGKGRASAEMIAVDIQTGKIVHSTQLNQFAWSSPVGFLNEKNEMYISQATLVEPHTLSAPRPEKYCVRSILLTTLNHRHWSLAIPLS